MQKALSVWFLLAAACFFDAALSSQVTVVSFAIATADRIAGKTAVSVTLGFIPTTALPAGGKITLSYPAGFFAPTTTPVVNVAGSTSATSAVPGATSIVITTAVTGISANTAFTITLSGLTMGAATDGSVTGITVQSDTDTTASAGVSSGGIFSHSPSQPAFSPSYPQNLLHLSIQTSHLCAFQSATRNCLLQNVSFSSG